MLGGGAAVALRSCVCFGACGKRISGALEIEIFLILTKGNAFNLLEFL